MEPQGHQGRPDDVGKYNFVVVANRLPVDRVETADGSEQWRRSPGGLVTALEPIMQSADGAWIGWSGSAGEGPEPFDSHGMRLVAVPLSAEDVRDYYEGFCNATLWPLYHDVIAAPEFHRHWWEAYLRANERFAAIAASQAAPEAVVWVHDYQLQLVPAMLRRQRPDLRIGFFNHIPFPGYEIFAQLPWRRQLVEGLLGADLLGFQRQGDVTNFMRACRRAARLATRGTVVPVPRLTGEPGDGSVAAERGVGTGATADRGTGTGAGVGAGTGTGAGAGAGTEPEASAGPNRPGRVRQVRAAAFPISIDAAELGELASRDQVRARAREIRESLGDPEVVFLGVDRLDYTKGILHRLKAYSELLDSGQLDATSSVLVQVATPSRERVEQYKLLRDEIEGTVGRINGDHSTLGHPAIHYLHQSFPRDEMAALYLAADVMLVTALRDGMNLVAKEFVACRHDETGVLVLSEFTGAADELTSAFLVNPHDIEGLKDTIIAASRLSPREASRRMRAMRRRVRDNDVHFWATSFLETLRGTAPVHVS